MATSNKRGLGKGLGALIPQGSVFTGGRTIVNIEITKIVPNPRQPRSEFQKDALEDLANSIKEQGVIEPILTRLRGGKYEIVAGERRFRAAKLAGLTSLPSIVKEFSDEQSLELALIENLQREDLNPMDEAEGYAQLIKEFSLTQEEAAKKVGKGRTVVANMLRILSLPEKIKHSLRKGEITVGHSRALLAIEGAEKQIEVWKQIIQHNLNVRDVEVLVRGAPTTEKPKAKGGRKRAYTQNVELNAIVEKLTTFFGTKVKAHGTSDRGRIEIEYYSKDDLERILEMLLGEKMPAETMPEYNAVENQRFA
ncbi:MAG: ParB/RepB/Spo0J family partition protein [Candidatus Margulisbacteria bacterium]|nr:ParB/RepB/Spo0J family partition protein [Candidatus Margulisiibacteriota bacterium]